MHTDSHSHLYAHAHTHTHSYTHTYMHAHIHPPTHTLTQIHTKDTCTLFISVPPTPSPPDTPWELDKPDQLVIVHLPEEVQPPQVATVVSLVMEDIQIDESREQTYEYQGVENTVTWTTGGKKEKKVHFWILQHKIYSHTPTSSHPHTPQHHTPTPSHLHTST